MNLYSKASVTNTFFCFYYICRIKLRKRPLQSRLRYYGAGVIQIASRNFVEAAQLKKRSIMMGI